MTERGPFYAAPHRRRPLRSSDDIFPVVTFSREVVTAEPTSGRRFSGPSPGRGPLSRTLAEPPGSHRRRCHTTGRICSKTVTVPGEMEPPETPQRRCFLRQDKKTMSPRGVKFGLGCRPPIRLGASKVQQFSAVTQIRCSPGDLGEGSEGNYCITGPGYLLCHG